MDAHSAISELMEEIGQELRALTDERSRLARILRENQEQIAKVNARMDAFNGILESLSSKIQLDGTTRNGSTQPAQVFAARINGKGATAAIMELLEVHPKGLARQNVIRDLQGVIDSDAEDKSRVLYNTLLSLQRRGKIAMVNDDGTAKYILPQFKGVFEIEG